MNCPIDQCVSQVEGPLRVCRAHYTMIPKPQQEALAHYARSHKGGPAHRASFERAVESIEKTIAFHKTLVPEKKPAPLPYRDD
jgi:hypothetical protein